MCDLLLQYVLPELLYFCYVWWSLSLDGLFPSSLCNLLAFSLNILFCLYCSCLFVYLLSLCALACSVCFRSSLQSMSCSSAVILCFLRMILSFLLVMLVVFLLVFSDDGYVSSYLVYLFLESLLPGWWSASWLPIGWWFWWCYLIGY